MKKKIFQIEEIFNIFNKNFISNWKNINFEKKILQKLILLQKLPNDINSIRFVLGMKNLTQKIIYVDREFVEYFKKQNT